MDKVYSREGEGVDGRHRLGEVPERILVDEHASRSQCSQAGEVHDKVRCVLLGFRLKIPFPQGVFSRPHCRGFGASRRLS